MELKLLKKITQLIEPKEYRKFLFLNFLFILLGFVEVIGVGSIIPFLNSLGYSDIEVKSPTQDKVEEVNSKIEEVYYESEIDKEIVRAQVIIDGVNEDKSGISGADIMDGLLYFPFNMIAKSQNYKNSLSAADKRIERLENLKDDNNCKDTSQEIAKSKSSLSQELKELTKMYKSGDLSKIEFEKAKNKLLLGN